MKFKVFSLFRITYFTNLILSRVLELNDYQIRLDSRASICDIGVVAHKKIKFLSNGKMKGYLP